MLLLLVLGSFVQRPGRTTFDTKLDLTEGIGGFLQRATHLWNPGSAMGEVQNQAYGYFFPQGLFFWLGESSGLPPWIVQRAWTALLLVLAYEGARRLLAALHRGRHPGAAVVAGLAYAFAPRLLGVVGTISAEALPTVLLPWAVLPLVHARRGRLSPRVAGLFSALAVLGMSGVNATGVIAVLPLPLLLLVTGLRHSAGRRLAVWWVFGMVLATSWWVVPLLLLGRYSPPFLDYIETSVASTGPLTWFNALRGADHWVGFIGVGGEPWWPASYLLSVSTTGIVVTAAVAAIGLVGLCRRDLPLRNIWVGSFLIGIACLIAGHSGELGGPLAAQVQALLDGPLAPLRNVHKVDPLVRLPLALATGHLCLVASQAGWRVAEATSSVDRFGRIALPTVIIVTVLVGGFPLFSGDLRKPGWSEMPLSWRQAAARLASEQGEGRVLVLPGTGSGEQTWGSTVDEPLQPLAAGPWVVRNQVPLAPGTSIRLLDAIEDLISTGRGSTGLAPLLARSGISMVLLRNDLRAAASDAPPNLLVAQTLDHSPDLTRVGEFGDTSGGPALVLYRVDLPVARAEAITLEGLTTMAGGPEDLLTALEAQALQPGSPVLFGDEPDLQGDGYRLVERKYGSVHDARTDVRSPADPQRTPNRSTDYAAVDGQRAVVREHASIRAMAASSSEAYVDALGPAVPSAGPYAAVDGNPTTAWRTDKWRAAEAAWLEMELRRRLPVASVRIATVVDGSAARVDRVVVDTGAQRRVVPVDARTGVAEVALNRTPVARIRVSLRRAAGAGGSLAISEIAIPGVVMAQTLRMPAMGATGRTGFLFTSAPAQRPCLPAGAGAWCDTLLAAPAEEPAGIRRTFTIDTAGRYRLSGAVLPRSAPATLALTEPLPGNAVLVRADSTFGDDPLVAPQRLLDGRPATGWMSEPGADQATVTLRWGEKRTLRRLRITPLAGSRAPTRAILHAGSQQREIDLRGDWGLFAPLRTDEVTLTLSAPPGEAPLGAAELVIEGLQDLQYRPDAEAPTGAICGYGPPVRVDGRTVPTRVRGVQEDLAGLEMALEPCGPDSARLDLAAGEHVIEVAPTGQFAAIRLALTPETRQAPALTRRAVTIGEWDATQRSVRVAAGPEALLRIPENLNAGWSATLDGRTLRTVAVDGWQQGYLIPAGSGGVVHLTYRPDRLYRSALLLGGLGAGLLLVLAWVLGRRDRDRLTGPWSLRVSRHPEVPGVGGRIRRAWWVCFGAGLVGGPAPAIGAVIGMVLPVRWTPMVVATAAFTAVVLSGWVAPIQREPSDLTVVWAAGIAVGAVAVHAVMATGRRGRRRG